MLDYIKVSFLFGVLTGRFVQFLMLVTLEVRATEKNYNLTEVLSFTLSKMYVKVLINVGHGICM